MAEDTKPDLRRVSVTLSDEMARALDADASGRMLSRAEVVRQAVRFDLVARSREAGALADAISRRSAATQRLAQILASPVAARLGRRIDDVTRASRRERAARNFKGKPDA